MTTTKGGGRADGIPEEKRNNSMKCQRNVRAKLLIAAASSLVIGPACPVLAARESIVKRHNSQLRGGIRGASGVKRELHREDEQMSGQIRHNENSSSRRNGKNNENIKNNNIQRRQQTLTASAYIQQNPFFPQHETSTCLDSRIPSHVYEEWMAWEGGYAESHFFPSAEECCKTWFPGGDAAAVDISGGDGGEEESGTGAGNCVEKSNIENQSVDMAEATETIQLDEAFDNNSNNQNNENNNNNGEILDGMTQSLTPLEMTTSLTSQNSQEELVVTEEPPPPSDEIHPTDYQGPQSMTQNSASANSQESTEFLGAWQIAQQSGIQAPGASQLTSNNLQNNDEATFPTFSCGTGWTSASQCNILCNSGLGCPEGQSCYAGIPCPASLVAAVMNANGNADEGMLGYIDGALNGKGTSGGVSTNVCGNSFEDAERRCQGGNSGNGNLGFTEDFIECPSGGGCPEGLSCYGGILCPPPPTISPAPTRSPVANYEPGGNGYRILAYYAAWQWYDRQKLAQPRNLNYSMMTRINYAFFEIDAAGNIFGTDSWADPRILFGDVILAPPAGQVCTAEDSSADGCFCHWVGVNEKSCSFHNYKEGGLIYLAHQAEVEIYPSIGGWTLSEPFPPMSASVDARKNFIEGCVGLIKEYGFDGIDIDWEYPGYEAHGGTPQDGTNFKLLLRELRDALDALGDQDGRYYGLTAALPCGPSNIANQDVPYVADVLDELNLMTYDFHGAWDAITGVNAPLYDQAEGDPEPGWSVHGCVENWVGENSNNAKGDTQRPKVNIGLPFYGRSYLDAKELYVPHGGLDEINWKEDDGSPQYFNIMARMGEMTSVRDNVTKTQYAYFDNGMGMVTYDDERAICDKAEYVLDFGLGGFIIWEISGDMMDDLHTPLLEALNRKLAIPEIDCEESFPSPEKVTVNTANPLPEASFSQENGEDLEEFAEEPLDRKDKTEVVGIPPPPEPIIMEVPVAAPESGLSSNESPYTIDKSELGTVPVAATSCDGGCPSGSICVGNQASGQLITDEECTPCGSGQTWWPCDVQGLCWCWIEGTNRIAPAPESGVEIEVADPHYTVCDDILTREKFDVIAPNARDPYSYTGLCDAILSYNSHHSEKAFGMGNAFQRTAELAAFLGNTLHESDEFKAGREYLMCADHKIVGDEVYCKPCDSGSFDWATFTCGISLISGTADFNEYCQPSSVPPEACNCGNGKGQTGDLEGYVPASDLFFGRGAIQLSWNYNYIGASVALTGSPDTFCDDPDLVATVGEYAWGAGLYFWMEHVKEGTTSHMESLADGGDFGGTLNNINGGLECPAHGGWHEEAVKARLNRYCRAAKVLGLPNLMHLGGCAGLEDKLSVCLGEGTCSDCQDYVGTTPGDVINNFMPPAQAPASQQVEQVIIEPENPCEEGLMQLEGHPNCCVPNTAFIGDGACDPYEPYNTEACGFDGGDCCKETCNEDSPFGCKAKAGGEFDGYGPFGFFCLDPTQISAINANYCTVVDRERIGDGKCNPGTDYNSHGCNYDGGDCCPETCDDEHSFYACGSGVHSYVCVDPRFKVDTVTPTKLPTEFPTTESPTKNSSFPTNRPTSTSPTHIPTSFSSIASTVKSTDYPTYSTSSPTLAPFEPLVLGDHMYSDNFASSLLSETNQIDEPLSSTQFADSSTVIAQNSEEGSPKELCPQDVFQCDNGVYVSRDPSNGCEFKSCPGTTDEMCAQDMFKCDNGVYVSRDPLNGCNFKQCPTQPDESNISIKSECPPELYSCGNGVFVAMNPADGCAYFPCPEVKPAASISMASAVHSKYGDKMPDSSSHEIETQCSQELFKCPSHEYLFVGRNPNDRCKPFLCPTGEAVELEDVISMAASVSETSGEAILKEDTLADTTATVAASAASAVHSKRDETEPGCSNELKRCGDNSFVGRNPDDNCRWFACLSGEQSIASEMTESVVKKCTSDLQKCPDGSLVRRDPSNKCHFFACPSPTIEQVSSEVNEQSIASSVSESIVNKCTSDLQKCPDGSLVGRNSNNKCHFFACPPSSMEELSSAVDNSSEESIEMAHHEYSLLPSHDATIRQMSPSTNYHDDNELKVDVDSGTYNSLISFDISPLIAGEIHSAKLKIYATDSAATSGGMVEGTDGTSWDEASVTWTSAPAGDKFVADILGPVKAGHWYTLNVASLLRSAIDEDRDTITLRLSTLDNNRAAYASKEFMDGEFSPRLIIEVVVPSTVTPQVNQGSTTQPPPNGTELVSSLNSVTLFASDDTYIDESESEMNFSRMRTLMVDGAPHRQDALVRFDVSNINFEYILSASLHLFVTDTAPGAKFTLTNHDWNESNISWDNAPSADGNVLADLQNLREGWLMIDATVFFQSEKTSYMSVRIEANSDNRLQFSSKEGDHGPKLIIILDETM